MVCGYVYSAFHTHLPMVDVLVFAPCVDGYGGQAFFEFTMPWIFHTFICHPKATAFLTGVSKTAPDICGFLLALFLVPLGEKNFLKEHQPGKIEM